MTTNYPSSSTQSPRKHSPLGSIFTIAILGAILFGIINFQWVLDTWTNWQYKPTPAIAKITERSGVSQDGKFMFYASTPRILEADEFNIKCRDSEDSTSILGCYTAGKIYVYNIKNPELDGVHEVTAMHEMLHAVYERMGPSEKKRINALLEAEYQKVKNDKSLQERMKIYARLEPGQRDNELHSILGTELATLSPELSEHYDKYFADRSKIVGLYQKYNAVFTRLENRANELVSQLKSMETAITNAKENYAAKLASLDSKIASFNARADSGAFSTQAAFNAERAQLVRASNQLDAERSAINAEIERYVTLSDELQSISLRSQELNKSINSTLAPSATKL